MPSFLVAGSIAYDMLLTYDGSFADGIDPERLEELSVGYVTQHLVKHFGGTAANISWNLRLLNQDVFAAGSVGNDGSEYLERLKGKGINVSLVAQDAEDVTPTAIIGTDTNERQITFYHPGADRKSQGIDMGAVKNQVDYAIISPHSTVSMERTARSCEINGIPYIFDPGQQILQFSQDELHRLTRASSAVIVNSYEWRIFSDALGWDEDEVLEATDLLIVTHGEHGIGVRTKEESKVIDAVETSKLVNPTGAGDAFRAGVLTGLARDWEVEEAVRLGAGLASFIVENEGTQLEEFYLADLEERIERQYKKGVPGFV